MAMELQQHMIRYIPASILAHVVSNDGGPNEAVIHFATIAELYADAMTHAAVTNNPDLDFEDTHAEHTRDAAGLALDEMVDRITLVAESTSTSTNDFREFYVDDWTTIAFCTDDLVEAHCEFGFTHYRVVDRPSAASAA